MILLLILFVLLVIAGKMFLGMALEVAGGILAVLLVLIIYFVRRKRQ